MAQKIEDKADAAEVKTQETRNFMQQVRVAAKRKYTPEEKVCSLVDVRLWHLGLSSR